MSKTVIPEQYQGFRVVSASEMSEIDRRTIEEYGVPSLMLMENAGKRVAVETALFVRARLDREISKAMITICCGRGNNGGDGLVAGRFLKEMGAEVVAYIARPRRDGGYPPEVVENLKRAGAAGVSLQEVDEGAVGLDVRLRSCDAVIDALLGTGAAGKPSGIIRTMIQRIMKAGKPVISVDIPSGINPDTGHHSGVFISATLTLTLGLPKKGLLAEHAKRNVGELKVVDIGFPEDLLQ